MLDIRQIESFYPESSRIFKRNLLREYLQYKILEIIYDSKYGNRLAFMGGTAIHIVHFNARFSEDLDFDNLGLNKKEFVDLGTLIKEKLSVSTSGYPNCSTEIISLRTREKKFICKLIWSLKILRIR